MNTHPPQAGTQIRRYAAPAACDGVGTLVSPAAMLVESRPRGPARLVALDRPDRLKGHPAWGSAAAVSLPDSVLIPGLVNAHTHLDLTHVGPRPFDRDRGFT